MIASSQQRRDSHLGGGMGDRIPCRPIRMASLRSQSGKTWARLAVKARTAQALVPSLPFGGEIRGRGPKRGKRGGATRGRVGKPQQRWPLHRKREREKRREEKRSEAKRSGAKNSRGHTVDDERSSDQRMGPHQSQAGVDDLPPNRLLLGLERADLAVQVPRLEWRKRAGKWGRDC